MAYFILHCLFVLVEGAVVPPGAKVADKAAAGNGEGVRIGDGDAVGGGAWRCVVAAAHLATISLIVQPFRSLLADSA
jgi:hypothetical protein